MMKEHLFLAIAHTESEPAARAIEESGNLRYYGTNRYALLNAWQRDDALMAALHTALIACAREPSGVQQVPYWTSHVGDLLREFYHRYRTLPDYAWLCREVGAQQGWPYEELVARYRSQANWQQVLTWTGDGLEQLPAESHYRPLLQEARGEALLHLNRPAEALETLRPLFSQQRSISIYLKLRDAAHATDHWPTLWPQLEEELRTFVVSQAGGTQYTGSMVSYPGGIFPAAGLLGYAYLLEGAWQEAIAWASDPRIPPGYADDDVLRIVATGLLRLALVSPGVPLDDVLAQALVGAPKLIR